MNREQMFRVWAPVLAAVAVTTACAVYWLAESGSLSRLAGGYEVKMATPSAAGLGTGTSVRMAGLNIGRVTSIERRGSGALVTMRLDGDHGPLPRDSSGAIRLRTLVGENYITIAKGRARETLPDGGVLAADRGNEYVEVDQILSVLKGKTRERAQDMLQGLGKGLDGKGDELNSVLDDGGGFIREASPVVDLLHEDRARVARLIDNLGAVMRVVADRGASIRTASQDARTTFQAIGERDTAVENTLVALPPTLRQVRSTTRMLQAVSTRATPTVVDLTKTLSALTPVLRRLGPAATTGRQLVTELDRTAPRATTLVENLGRTAPVVAQTLPHVRQVLCEVNPALQYLRPYAKEIATVLQNLGSVTNWHDRTGNAARLFATLSSDDLAGFTPQVAKFVDELMGLGAVGGLGPMRGYDALPAPGTIGQLKDGLGVSGPSDVKKPYPRITAAC